MSPHGCAGDADFLATEEWRDWSCAVTVTTAAADDLGPAAAAVRAVMREVECAASRFRSDSDLARINTHAGRYVVVRPTTLRLIAVALEAAGRTGGAVTPTIGAALIAQGYDQDIEAVRARAATQSPSPTVWPQPATPSVPEAASAIRVDTTFGRVGVTRGTVLDLGALAKAYAVDEAIARIAERGLGPALVSIGGDLAVHGEQSWTIAVSETADDPAQMITIDSGALATSSTRGRRWAGERHHIIDPRTGQCATGIWRTATIWAPTAVEANTLSTWALVDAEGLAAALAEDPRPARLVGAAGEVVRWHGWPEDALEQAS